jgi:hypothetical protein
VGTFWH